MAMLSFFCDNASGQVCSDAKQTVVAGVKHKHVCHTAGRRMCHWQASVTADTDVVEGNICLANKKKMCCAQIDSSHKNANE